MTTTSDIEHPVITGMKMLGDGWHTTDEITKTHQFSVFTTRAQLRRRPDEYQESKAGQCGRTDIDGRTVCFRPKPSKALVPAQQPADSERNEQLAMALAPPTPQLGPLPHVGAPNGGKPLAVAAFYPDGVWTDHGSFADMLSLLAAAQQARQGESQ